MSWSLALHSWTVWVVCVDIGFGLPQGSSGYANNLSSLEQAPCM